MMIVLRPGAEVPRVSRAPPPRLVWLPPEPAPVLIPPPVRHPRVGTRVVAPIPSAEAREAAVAVPAPPPLLSYRPWLAPVLVAPAAPRVVSQAEAAALAAPLAEGGATSVGLEPGPGTDVTSTPADLTVGPETLIEDFTIWSLDAGEFQ